MKNSGDSMLILNYIYVGLLDTILICMNLQAKLLLLMQNAWIFIKIISISDEE